MLVDHELLINTIQEMGYDPIYRIRNDSLIAIEIYKNRQLDKTEIAGLTLDKTKVLWSSLHYSNGEQGIGVDLADPDSIPKIKKYIDYKYRMVVKKSAQQYLKFIFLILSILFCIVSFLVQLPHSDDLEHQHNRQLSIIASSFNIELSINIIDKMIDSIKLDPNKKDTTILWIDDPIENVAIYKQNLEVCKQILIDCNQKIQDMKTPEADREKAMTLFRLESKIPLVPPGLVKYPYNRTYVMISLTAFICLMTSFYLYRDKFK